MGGGGGTQRTRTEPWSGQQPYLQDVFGQAQRLYRQGPQQFFPGTTVAPFSPQTQAALNMEQARAMGGDPSQRMLGGYLTGAMGQPQVSAADIYGGGMGAMGNLGLASQYLQQAGQAPTFGQAAGMAGVNPYAQAITPDFMQTARGIQTAGLTGLDPTAAGQLGATARGAFMPGANPYLDALYQTGAGRIGETFQEQTMPALAAQFGGAGRTGSGAQALMAGRAAGDVAEQMRGLYGDIYAPAYEAERGRQLEAAAQLGGLAQRGGLAGLQTAADIYGRDIGRELGMGQQDIARRQLAADIYGGGLGRMAGVGGQLGTLGLGGLEALRGLRGDIGTEAYRAATLTPTMQQMQYADIDRLLRGGGQIEDQAQRLIDAARQRYEFEQMAPYQALGQYANIIQGMPSGYGTTTRPGPGGGSRIAGAIGGGLTGFGATGNPIGAGLGALGGLLAA